MRSGRMCGWAVLALWCAGCAGRSNVLWEGPVAGPLEVRLNGAGPYRFGLDTGQSIALLIQPELARTLALPVTQQIPASDGNAAHAQTVDVVRVAEVSFGRTQARDVLGLALASGANGRPELHGACGFPLFADGLLTLDYPRGRMRYESGGLPPADGRKVLDYVLRQDLPRIPIRVGPLEVEAVLDSGSQAAVMLPLALAERLPLESPPQPAGRMATLFAELDVYEARLAGELRIGEYGFTRPVLRFTDHFDEANLGRGILREFRVTFDQRTRRVRFER